MFTFNIEFATILEKEMFTMKTIVKKVSLLILVLLIVLSSTVVAFAHSGRTDSSGGHRDNKNASGLGSYHYHCGGYPAHLHKSGYCPYTDVFPSSVKIKAAKTALKLGEEIEIDATVSPSNACSTSVSWDSSDSSIVSVRYGTLVAKGYGTATITAETFNGKKSTIKITVKEIKADKVTVSGLPDSLDHYIGETFPLVATITPDNVDDNTIIWTSSNENIATVSESGDVTLLAEGDVEIIATASNGVAGKVPFAVKEKHVESVDIENESIDLILGEEQKINAIVLPNDATYPELIWTIDNPEIASVSDDGVVKALSCGNAVITASSKNNMSDSISIQVNEIKAESLTIEGENKMQVGDFIYLSAIFSPTNTTNQNVKWEINDSEIATIDSDGKLTAQKSGKVTVIATSANGIKAEYEVKISSPATAGVAVVGIAGAGAAIVGIAKKKKKNS